VGLKMDDGRFGNMKHTQKPPVSEAGWTTCFSVQCKSHVECLPVCLLQQRLSLQHSYIVGFDMSD
jgi:hypothetical protein